MYSRCILTGHEIKKIPKKKPTFVASKDIRYCDSVPSTRSVEIVANQHSICCDRSAEKCGPAISECATRLTRSRLLPVRADLENEADHNPQSLSVERSADN